MPTTLTPAVVVYWAFQIPATDWLTGGVGVDDPLPPPPPQAVNTDKKAANNKTRICVGRLAETVMLLSQLPSVPIRQ